jgi:hypothetical protein
LKTVIDSSTEVVDMKIEKLKGARESVAVLKLRLASLRAKLPKSLVFAFEGDDDKIVYYQWIRRIKPSLDYEPFPCKGKRRVIQLREMLKRDLNKLGEGVYFFVDRDFDLEDVPGCNFSERTFITDKWHVSFVPVHADVDGWRGRHSFKLAVIFSV